MLTLYTVNSVFVYWTCTVLWKVSMSLEVSRKKTKTNCFAYNQRRVSVLSNGTIHAYSIRVCQFSNSSYKRNKYHAEFAALWKTSVWSITCSITVWHTSRDASRKRCYFPITFYVTYLKMCTVCHLVAISRMRNNLSWRLQNWNADFH